MGSRPSDGIRRQPDERSRWDMRDAYSIDVDRILHSAAYTSYTDKTQVFYLVGHQGIAHRVIHVQLLSRIARTIGRKLGLNEDLIEAIAIGHDIGHPPFGHDGESYLDTLCRDAGIGRFRHNIQAIQALERIERQGRGLNLTLQVLDGILCHNGELTEQRVSPGGDTGFTGLDVKLKVALEGENPSPMTLEGCLVRMADTVSYIGRDIEDAVSLGIITRSDLPREATGVLGNTNGRIVYTLVADLIEHSTPEGIAYSEEVFQALQRLKVFNYEHIYHHARVKTESEKIRTMYALVFARLCEDLRQARTSSPICRRYLDHMQSAYTAHTSPTEVVRDFIASLTDSAFLRLFHDLYVPVMLL